jgi:hypothetical protein
LLTVWLPGEMEPRRYHSRRLRPPPSARLTHGHVATPPWPALLVYGQ